MSKKPDTFLSLPNNDKKKLLSKAVHEANKEQQSMITKPTNSIDSELERMNSDKTVLVTYEGTTGDVVTEIIEPNEKIAKETIMILAKLMTKARTYRFGLGIHQKAVPLHEIVSALRKLENKSRGDV